MKARRSNDYTVRRPRWLLCLLPTTLLCAGLLSCGDDEAMTTAGGDGEPDQYQCVNAGGNYYYVLQAAPSDEEFACETVKVVAEDFQVCVPDNASELSAVAECILECKSRHEAASDELSDCEKTWEVMSLGSCEYSGTTGGSTSGSTSGSTGGSTGGDPC